MNLRLAAQFAAPSFAVALFVSGTLLVTEPGTARASDWVRTTDGWEHEEALRPRHPIYEPGLHPLVLASFVTLASILALVAFPASNEKQAA